VRRAMSRLPTVILSQEDVATAKALLDACKTRGFFLLTGHGIPAEKVDKMFAHVGDCPPGLTEPKFSQSRTFHGQSTELKQTVRRPQNA
jgi:isopenicillin N synthase-like dioxygenase